jgi:hypothetical protein
MAKATPKLSELAAIISQKAAYLENYLEEHNLPQPSFSADGPSSFPVAATAQEASAARFALIDAAKDLRDLVVGPEDTLKWLVLNVHHITEAIHRPDQLTTWRRITISAPASKQYTTFALRNASPSTEAYPSPTFPTSSALTP